LPHAQGEPANPAPSGGREVDFRQHLLHAASWKAGPAGKNPQMVAGGAPRVKPGCFENRAHPMRGPVQLDVRNASDQRAASRRPNQPQNHPQRRGLPGAVRPDETGDRPVRHVEAQVVHRGDVSEALGQALH
jgi:hypothetical protein